MLELLFLLLPIAAAYGWFYGRNSLRREELKGKANVAKNLSSGLNFLLTDQEDKAIGKVVHEKHIDVYGIPDDGAILMVNQNIYLLGTACKIMNKKGQFL